jgi:Nitroreductase
MMMLDLLRKRRSIRKYQVQSLSRQEIEDLIKAALLSPSSRALRPWEFIIVTDPEMLLQLSRSKASGSTFLKGAAVGIVVLADPGKCDVWIEDASIAAAILHLTAASMNLGSCWIQIRQRFHDDSQPAQDYIKKLLNIPDRYQVESIIAAGYPAENKSPVKDSNLLLGKVHDETFGKAYFK